VSLVQGLHWCVVVLQIGPLVLPVQSVFTAQLPT
jgi:hypothetical protein